VPVYWRWRLARLWLVLAAVWGGLWLAIVVGETRHDGFWLWFFDAESPGWVWLIWPPLGLGLLLQAGGWLAWTIRAWTGPVRGHLSFETLLADAPLDPPADRPAADPAAHP
jgi:hypothetical protein